METQNSINSSDLVQFTKDDFKAIEDFKKALNDLKLGNFREI